MAFTFFFFRTITLKIYSGAGETTCAGYPASLGHEEIDAETWAEWGIDYLKYDNCGVPTNWTDQYTACVPDGSGNFPNGTCPDLTDAAPAGYDWTKSKTYTRYTSMRDALLEQNRTIFYSLCDWGNADVNTWGNETGNSWRMSGDISGISFFLLFPSTTLTRISILEPYFRNRQ